MRPTFTKTGINYLPVIVHSDGRREVLYGDPLTNGITATKYARLEIYERKRPKKFRCDTCGARDEKECVHWDYETIDQFLT